MIFFQSTRFFICFEALHIKCDRCSVITCLYQNIISYEHSTQLLFTMKIQEAHVAQSVRCIPGCLDWSSDPVFFCSVLLELESWLKCLALCHHERSLDWGSWLQPAGAHAVWKWDNRHRISLSSPLWFCLAALNQDMCPCVPDLLMLNYVNVINDIMSILVMKLLTHVEIQIFFSCKWVLLGPQQ